MLTPTIWDYRRQGTPQNILIEAGFLRVVDREDGMVLEVGPNLVRLFPNKDVPPVETLTSAMVELVVAHAFDQSGFLSSGDMRIQAVSDLRQAGMSHEAIGSLNQSIEETAKTAKVALAASYLARR